MTPVNSNVLVVLERGLLISIAIKATNVSAILQAIGVPLLKSIGNNDSDTVKVLPILAIPTRVL